MEDAQAADREYLEAEKVAFEVGEALEKGAAYLTRRGLDVRGGFDAKRAIGLTSPDLDLYRFYAEAPRCAPWKVDPDDLMPRMRFGAAFAELAAEPVLFEQLVQQAARPVEVALGVQRQKLRLSATRRLFEWSAFHPDMVAHVPTTLVAGVQGRPRSCDNEEWRRGYLAELLDPLLAETSPAASPRRYTDGDIAVVSLLGGGLDDLPAEDVRAGYSSVVSAERKAVALMRSRYGVTANMRERLTEKVEGDVPEGARRKAAVWLKGLKALDAPDGARADHHRRQLTDELLEWLDRRARAEVPPEVSAAAPIRSTLAMAQIRLEAGQWDEATREFLWLWDNMFAHAAWRAPVRQAYLAPGIRRLIAEHEPARATFLRRREEAAPRAGEEPTPEALAEWFSLNDVFGESDASLRWFDGACRPGELSAATIRVVDNWVAPLLLKRGRWADLATLYLRPIDVLLDMATEVMRAFGDLPGDPSPAVAAAHRAQMATTLRGTAVVLVRALTAAGRQDEATAVNDVALTLDPSPTMRAMLEDRDGIVTKRLEKLGQG